MRGGFIILAFLVGSLLHAQEAPWPTWRLTSTPTQWLFLELPITLEHASDRNTIGATIAFRPSTRSGGEVHGMMGLFGPYWFQNYWNWLYNSATIGISTKHSLFPRKNMFVGAEMLYRHWWFNRKEASYENVEGYRFSGLRSEQQDVIAFNLVLGGSSIKRIASGKYLVFEYFGGPGLQFKTCQFTTHSGIVYDAPVNELKETLHVTSLSFQFGIALGMGWDGAKTSSQGSNSK